MKRGNDPELTNLVNLRRTLQRNGVISKSGHRSKAQQSEFQSWSFGSTNSTAQPTSENPTTTKQPIIEEPDEIKVPSAEDPPIEDGEWVSLIKPAKLSRKVIVEPNGNQTVSEYTEESTLPYQTVMQEQRILNNAYNKRYDNIMRLNEMDYQMDKARQQIDAETRWRNMSIQQDRFNTQAQQQMQQAQFDHTRSTQKDQYAHEETMGKQKLKAQTQMKEMDLEGAKYAQKITLEDHKDARRHAEKLQANKNRHEEEMVKLNNIGTFVDAHNTLADGMHSRKMELKKYTDAKQREGNMWVSETQALVAMRKREKIIDICAKFGLPPNVVDDLLTPRQVQTRLIEKTNNDRYLHSILFTGVDKISIYNPYDPHVRFLDGRTIKLKWHGTKGYSYNQDQLTSTAYVAHVYKSTPEAVKSTYKNEWWYYYLSCCNNCDLA